MSKIGPVFRRTFDRLATTRRKAKAPQRNRRLTCEPLESRVLLSATWTGGSGNWSDTSQWAGGALPGVGDTAIISSSAWRGVNRSTRLIRP